MGWIPATTAPVHRAAFAAVAIGVVMGAAVPAAGQAFHQHGLNFVTVGDPGNRGATAAEAPLWPAWAPPLGAVDHTFGIMRTNVTNAQYIDFVRAYGQNWTGSPGAFALTGPGIFYTGSVGGVRQYEIGSGQENFSAEASWRVMARFTNWLHNDKVNEPWAFENGAYDTSTFGETTVGGQTVLTDQFTHNPGARFWIPTINEYTKAGYWDPDKNGPGQGGYWLMPNGGDERLVAGPPGVGECAGDWLPFPKLIDVESYPTTLSPWGLMDVSSTKHQFTEGVIHPSLGVYRMAGGSRPDAGYWVDDRLDNFNEIVGIQTGIYSLRVASAIPTPPTLSVLALAAGFAHRRRRHDTDSQARPGFRPARGHGGDGLRPPLHAQRQ